MKKNITFLGIGPISKRLRSRIENWTNKVRWMAWRPIFQPFFKICSPFHWLCLNEARPHPILHDFIRPAWHDIHSLMICVCLLQFLVWKNRSLVASWGEEEELHLSDEIRSSSLTWLGNVDGMGCGWGGFRTRTKAKSVQRKRWMRNNLDEKLERLLPLQKQTDSRLNLKILNKKKPSCHESTVWIPISFKYLCLNIEKLHILLYNDSFEYYIVTFLLFCTFMMTKYIANVSPEDKCSCNFGLTKSKEILSLPNLEVPVTYIHDLFMLSLAWQKFYSNEPLPVPFMTWLCNASSSVGRHQNFTYKTWTMRVDLV